SGVSGNSISATAKAVSGSGSWETYRWCSRAARRRDPAPTARLGGARRPHGRPLAAPAPYSERDIGRCRLVGGDGDPRGDVRTAGGGRTPAPAVRRWTRGDLGRASRLAPDQRPGAGTSRGRALPRDARDLGPTSAALLLHFLSGTGARGDPLGRPDPGGNAGRPARRLGRGGSGRLARRRARRTRRRPPALPVPRRSREPRPHLPRRIVAL